VAERHGARHHVHFFTEKPTITVDIDPDRVEQVLENLATNAETYTPAGGVILFALDLPTNDVVRVQVRDSGIGVPAADRQRVFEPFARGSNVEERHGAGLGLYISRVIAARHGGTLSVVDHDGPGSTFQLLLPVTRS
jgi:signal transduction histidine kinase